MVGRSARRVLLSVENVHFDPVAHRHGFRIIVASVFSSSFMRRIILLSCSLLLLVACGPKAPATSTDTPGLVAAVIPDVPLPPLPQKPAYLPFDGLLLGRDVPFVLFFAQKLDPFSERSDNVIRTVYASGSAMISTMRVEYGTATGERFRFGVVVPDSLVVLRSDGERLENLIHPSSEDIRALLRKSQ
jgi:hypothetical protein